MASQTTAPTPGNPAASLPAGGDAAGVGLAVVEGPDWRERLAEKGKHCGWGAGWIYAPVGGGTTIGLVINQGWWVETPYALVGLLASAIVTELTVKQVRKFEKRARRRMA